MFITLLVLALIVALCGHFIARQIRKSERLEMEDIMLEQKNERMSSEDTITGETTDSSLE